jgi:hypothetical protein
MFLVSCLSSVFFEDTITKSFCFSGQQMNYTVKNQSWVYGFSVWSECLDGEYRSCAIDTLSKGMNLEVEQAFA